MKETKPNYDCYSKCPICTGWNNTRAVSSVESHICEVETECQECGHKDYWAYGWYEIGGSNLCNTD